MARRRPWQRPADPTKPWQVGALLCGLVALGIGSFCLYHGLKPAGELMGTVSTAFSGGPPPEDLTERMAASTAELKARLPWDVAGGVVFLIGVVGMKLALRGPRPKTVEEQVQEAVEARMKALGLVPSPGDGVGANAPDPSGPGPAQLTIAAPAPAPAGSVAAAVAPRAVPATVPSPARCATCNALLVAGRFCRDGHV